MGILEKEIKEIIKVDNIVLDGELCSIDENGDEDFQSIMKEIRRKDHTILNPMFMIFDIIPVDSFEKEIHPVPFVSRLEELEKIIPENANHMKILPQFLVKDNKHLEDLKEKAKGLNWEGLILRKVDSIYEGKRTKTLLKVKSFIDAEYKVKDVEFGIIRYILNETEVEQEMLSNIIIEHKGFEVRVGSGFSIEDRLYYYSHPEELKGRTVTVKYFEETKNQDGGISLRFPTVKTIHGKDGRDT